MFKFIAILFCLVAATLACVPYDGTTGIGYITVCKDNGECFKVSSTRRTCINLVGGPFYTGYTASSTYHCKVYSGSACSGSYFAVGSTKVRFPWRAYSYTCPWKC